MSPRAIRILLGLLLALLAINAFGGGAYGIAGARDVPADWLAGSPFSSYMVPSVILFVVVGGAFALAAVAVAARSPLARMSSYGAAVIVVGWLAVQLAIIGYVSWLQPAVAVAAGVVIALTARLEPA
jgi:hypothetical protein